MAYEHQESAWLQRALTCYIVRRCQKIGKFQNLSGLCKNQ